MRSRCFSSCCSSGPGLNLCRWLVWQGS